MKLTIALLLAAAPAFAAPPEGADPNSPTAQWYRSLERPDHHQSCCDAADCRPVRAIMSPAGWRVLIEGEWLAVPPEKVLRRENPTGEPVACWLPATGIMCFVAPTLG